MRMRHPERIIRRSEPLRSLRATYEEAAYGRRVIRSCKEAVGWYRAQTRKSVDRLGTSNFVNDEVVRVLFVYSAELLAYEESSRCRRILGEPCNADFLNGTF